MNRDALLGQGLVCKFCLFLTTKMQYMLYYDKEECSAKGVTLCSIKEI